MLQWCSGYKRELLFAALPCEPEVPFVRMLCLAMTHEKHKEGHKTENKGLINLTMAG